MDAIVFIVAASCMAITLVAVIIMAIGIVWLEENDNE